VWIFVGPESTAGSLNILPLTGQTFLFGAQCTWVRVPFGNRWNTGSVKHLRHTSHSLQVNYHNVTRPATMKHQVNYDEIYSSLNQCAKQFKLTLFLPRFSSLKQSLRRCHHLGNSLTQQLAQLRYARNADNYSNCACLIIILLKVSQIVWRN